MLAASVIKGCQVTIGSDQGTAAAIEQMGAKHVNKNVSVSFTVSAVKSSLTVVCTLNHSSVVYANWSLYDFFCETMQISGVFVITPARVRKSLALKTLVSAAD